MEADIARDPADMRHGARARLRYLDERAFWEGRVNRSDVMERFGVSVPQATADLGRYQQLAPGNLAYDKRAKAYLTTAAFEPVFGAPSAEAWLHQQASVLPRAFPAEELPMPQRSLDPWLVRRVLEAMRQGLAIEMLYQTMQADEPEPGWRCVSPLVIASDGLRWHLRGYNHASGRHEDMVFPRILELRRERQGEVVPVDEDWETSIAVRIRPSQHLSGSQQRVVALDFNMHKGIAEVQVRAAMLLHFLRRMRLDRGSALIEIANAAEVRRALKIVGDRFGASEELI